MDSVIIHDEVHVQAFRNDSVDGFGKAEDLLIPVLTVAFVNNFASDFIQ